ncbi:hypothetical protein [Pedobacter polysacchareus]|uniref:hypothetical protein n=1 Tax=Pedobacter polysacchareus TaxID=2861973 RepID=UPI001C991E02|nr:hypothetical protein [Pedobacter polysacchareus]
MKNQSIDHLLKEEAAVLMEKSLDQTISAHQLLEISIFLYHYSKYTNSDFFKAAADQVLEQALSNPLDRNDTQLGGITAYGLVLEHLKNYHFITEDIDEILEDLDEGIYADILKLKLIDRSNKDDVLSKLNYHLKRSKLSDRSAEIDQKFISLFTNYYHDNYKGFLFGNNSSSIFIELACLNVLSDFQRRTNSIELLDLMDWIINSILYYIFMGQNHINVYNAKLLYALLNANQTVNNSAHKERIELCLNNYLDFLHKESHTISYQKHLNICNGLGSLLFDHLLLKSIFKESKGLDQFIEKIRNRIEDIEVKNQHRFVERDYSHISFLHSELSSGLIYLELQKPDFLLKLKPLFML